MLVIGGGIQGLVVLRELVAAGYSPLLVTKHLLGAGQTLHGHGGLASGTALLTGALRDEFEATMAYLGALGVPAYGEGSAFLAMADEVAEQLRPMWEANGYAPPPADPVDLPAGIEVHGRVYRVPGVSIDKRTLVERLAYGLERFIVRGEVVSADDVVEVRPTSGSTMTLRPSAIVAAAGCGTKPLLEDRFGVCGDRLAPITYTNAHMICLRGDSDVLPAVSAVLSPSMIIVGHGMATDRSSKHATWYVTPRPPAPEPYLDAPDDAVAPVERDTVKLAIEGLMRLVPALRRRAPVEAAVFAGYKQDYAGGPITRACELVDPDRNLFMVLPSVLANAVPNANDVVTAIRHRIGAPQHDAVNTSAFDSVAVGDVTEAAPDVEWLSWDEFARAYGANVGT